MVSYTPRHALPYPDPNDPLHTYDNIMKDLALAVDEKIDSRRHASGLKYVKNVTYFEEHAPLLAGYIVLQTNLTMGNFMNRIDFRGYTYWSTNNIIDLSVTGYAYQPDNTMYSFEANNRGTMQFREIKWMTRNSDGKVAIALLPYTGESSTVWHYPKIAVDAYVGHTEATADQMNGWTLTRVPNLNAYTVKKNVENSFWRDMPTGSMPGGGIGGGWGNYGSGYTNARYCKVGATVYLQGLIAGGTFGLPVFTLPAGMRPSGGMLIYETNGAAGAHRTDIFPDGRIVPQSGTNGFHSLAGIQFPAEA